jgi:serine/threonine-protein kinase
VSDPRVELRILGHTELSVSGERTGSFVLRQPKRLALLAYLALAATDRFRRRDQVVVLFWPDLDQAHARTQLRKVLHALRSTIGADTLVTRGEEEIRLDAARFWCDAAEFVSCVEREDWVNALELYRGDLLEGLYPGGVGETFQTWLDEQRTALRLHAARAAWECSNREDLAGRRREALALARRAVELDPDDEDGVRRLIAALDRYGDRAGALLAFQTWQKRLESEFGAEPAPETRKLARRVRDPRKGESTETPASLQPVPSARWSTTEENQPIAFAKPPATAARRRTPSVLALSAFVLLAAIVSGARVLGKRSAEATIAVLAFRNLEGSTDARFGEGLAEEITAELAKAPALTIRSTARSREAAVVAEDAGAIGRRLRVAFVLDGSIRRDSFRARVAIRLIRVKDGVETWNRMLDVPTTDAMAAQESVARTITADVLRALRGGP